MEKKNINKIVITVVAVALIIAVIGGATFAYWAWVTNTAQQTAVNVTVAQGINMTITPESATPATLAPTTGKISDGTTDLDTHSAVMKSTAIVSIENQTGILARPKFMLKLNITNASGASITNSSVSNNTLPGEANELVEDGVLPGNISGVYRNYINYTITESNGDCDNPIASGNFGESGSAATSTGNGYYNSKYITLDEYHSVNNAAGVDGFPDLTSENSKSVSFNAQPYATTPHTYKVCVWLDESYSYINVGDNSTDPMQNAHIIVTWSEDSEVIQVTA